MTSHDVVNRLRRILGQRKIGHTGTLDPQAEGVLPICLGAGTKLCGRFADAEKEYLAVLRLGLTTDTQDMTGTVRSEREVLVTEEKLREIIRSFEGTYGQLPPMYSAVKHQGKKLYQLARAGIEVERVPRQVVIHKITVEELFLPTAVLRVRCSKGTYIRTLCEDIGKAAGCGGCMAGLKRTAAGPFVLNDALRLSRVEELEKEGKLGSYIHPIDEFYRECGEAFTVPEADYLLRNGNPLAREDFARLRESGESGCLRMYDHEGVFYGIYRHHPSFDLYRPEKMFRTVQGKPAAEKDL